MKITLGFENNPKSRERMENDEVLNPNDKVILKCSTTNLPVGAWGFFVVMIWSFVIHFAA
jgi:hypothetical protein